MVFKSIMLENQKLNLTTARQWKLKWWSSNAFDMPPVMWINLELVFAQKETRVTSRRSGQSLLGKLIRVLWYETRDTLSQANAISR